jgi:hypothetical protein
MREPSRRMGGLKQMVKKSGSTFFLKSCYRNRNIQEAVRHLYQNGDLYFIRHRRGRDISTI